MLPGEIYLGRFPFGGSAGSKVRPTLLLTGPVGSVPEYLAAYISSAIPTPLLPSDLLVDPAGTSGAGTNLKAMSVIRLHKLFTMHERDLFRRVGGLPVTAMRDVEARLRTLLNL